MGNFFGNDDDAPDVNYTPYKPVKTSDDNLAINYMKIFDAVSGQNFSFRKGSDGTRYIQLKNLIERKENELANTKLKWSNDPYSERRPLENELANLRGEFDIEREKQKVAEISVEDVSGRVPLDSPYETVMPEVGQLAPFTLRYAAAVADVTARLRTLGQSFENILMADPNSIPQLKPQIEAFKKANNMALEKGFDIASNGLDNKLRQMGLNASTTALGALITLQKQKVDTEVENNFKEQQFASGLKQETLQSMLGQGKLMAEEGNLELNKFATESQNELTARGQDLNREQLVQQRSNNLLQAEIRRREIGLNLVNSRNPANLALPFLNNNAQTMIHAGQVDNQAMHNIQANELQKSQVEQDKFRYEQMAQSNPFQSLLTTGVGALAGGYAGGLGSTLGFKHAGGNMNNLKPKSY